MQIIRVITSVMSLSQVTVVFVHFTSGPTGAPRGMIQEQFAAHIFDMVIANISTTLRFGGRRIT